MVEIIIFIVGILASIIFGAIVSWVILENRYAQKEFLTGMDGLENIVGDVLVFTEKNGENEDEENKKG